MGTRRCGLSGGGADGARCAARVGLVRLGWDWDWGWWLHGGCADQRYSGVSSRRSLVTNSSRDSVMILDGVYLVL